MKYDYFDEVIAAIEEKVDRQAEELFGDAETLPDDEFEIVFSSMAHADKLETLTILRAFKAQGLGVLDTADC